MLMIFGMLAVYSSIAYFAETRGTTAAALLSEHMIKLGIAFFVMLIFSKIDYHNVIRFSRVAVVISWLMLIADAPRGSGFRCQTLTFDCRDLVSALIPGHSLTADPSLGPSDREAGVHQGFQAGLPAGDGLDTADLCTDRP